MSNAYSNVPSLQYLAPEVLHKQPYDRTVDWWCLGAVIYEMLYGLVSIRYDSAHWGLVACVVLDVPSIGCRHRRTRKGHHVNPNRSIHWDHTPTETAHNDANYISIGLSAV